jgi:hypothetical protein
MNVTSESLLYYLLILAVSLSTLWACKASLLSKSRYRRPQN